MTEPPRDYVTQHMTVSAYGWDEVKDTMVYISFDQLQKLQEDSSELRWYKAQMPIVLEELDDLRRKYRDAYAAVRVYTSDLHRCSNRPCSCGAFSSLRAVVYGDENA